MPRYPLATILLVTLLLVRVAFNGLSFMETSSLRALLFMLLFAAATVGIVFSKRWSYLLSKGTAISEFSILAVSTTFIPLELGTLFFDALIVIFSIWGFYRFGSTKARRRRR